MNISLGYKIKKKENTMRKLVNYVKFHCWKLYIYTYIFYTLFIYNTVFSFVLLMFHLTASLEGEASGLVNLHVLISPKHSIQINQKTFFIAWKKCHRIIEQWYIFEIIESWIQKRKLI